MKSIFPLVAAGAGALLLAGSVALAAGQPAVHDLTVQLPGGGVEHIRYTGKVAPKIVFDTDPFWAVPVEWSRPFAVFDALDMAMDRQMDAMLRQATALQAATGSGLSEAGLRDLPPGTSSFTWISTTDGARSCTRTIQVNASDGGAKPQVISQTSGDCGDGHHAASGAIKPIQAKWDSATERAGRSAL
jgi:hypothetical protein